MLGGVWDRPVECWYDRTLVLDFPHSVRWEWHAGFPADFSLPTLAGFMGQTCEACNGENIWARKSQRMKYCKTCSCTGRVNALAPRLLAAAPVRSVRFADKTPDEARIGFCWYPESPNQGVNNHNDIPADLYAALKNDPRDAHGSYRSLEAAHDALSDAAIRWARQAKTSGGT